MTTTPTPRPSRRRRRRGPMFTQQGIALLVVTTTLMIIGFMAKEFATNTTIDSFGAANSRDQMRAEFLARSSLNLSELILRLQQVLDNPQVQNQLGAMQITDWADTFMSAFGGTDDEVKDALGPITGDEAKAFGADIGSFGVTISTEDGKLNVNCANGKTEYLQLTYTMLEALYYFPAFDPVFQDADADGWHRDRRLQTEAIMDYIDQGANGEVKVTAPGEPRSTAGEDYGYESLRDSYKPKNNYLDSLDELKLVRGVDDRFWTLFAPAFTVYGGCKLNVRSVEDPRIIAAVIFLTAENKEDPVLRDGALLWYHALAISYARQNGYFFNTTADFVEFAKDPEAQLGLGLTPPGGEAGGGAAPPPIQIPGVPQGIDLGVELKQTEVDKVLRAGPQRTYRLEAWGAVDRGIGLEPLRRTLMTVWDMGTVNVNMRSTDPKSRNGAWVYLRIQ